MVSGKGCNFALAFENSTAAEAVGDAESGAEKILMDMKVSKKIRKKKFGGLKNSP